MPPKKLEHVAEKTNKASSKTTAFQPEIWYIDLPYFCEAPVLSVTRPRKSKGCVYKDFLSSKCEVSYRQCGELYIMFIYIQNVF